MPEISANKYALNIRFIGVSGMDRGAVYDGDVEFELMFCNLASPICAARRRARSPAASRADVTKPR